MRTSRLTKRRRISPPRGANPELARALLTRLLGRSIRKCWIDLVEVRKADGTATYTTPGGSQTFTNKHAAIRAYLGAHPPRQYGGFVLEHDSRGIWALKSKSSGRIAEAFARRPTREELAWAIRSARQSDATPSYTRPTTLGWRTFNWDGRERYLVSPSQRTPWPTPEHQVPRWHEGDVVRGKAGVHACRLPRGDWKLADRPSDMPHGLIVALVERFGKFVLGTEGWRAEWVIIRELLAPNESFARVLREVYPEVKVSIAHPNHWTRKELQ